MRRGGFSRSWIVPIGALLVLAVGVGELAAVADLKVQQLAEWRQQLLTDVGSLLSHPIVRGAMVRVAAGRARPGDLEQAAESLRSRLGRLRLRRGSLVDAGGRVVAATTPRPSPTAQELAALRASRASGGPHLDSGAAADGRLLVALAL